MLWWPSNMHHGKDIKRQPNPKERANLFTIITFLFTFGLLKKGYKRDITEDDIYQVLPKFTASKIGNQIEKQWLLETKFKTKPSIYRLLWSCYGKYYLLLGIPQVTMKLIMVTIHPNAFGKLVSYFSGKLTKSDAIYYASVVIFLNLLQCTYGHNYMLLITELGIKIKTAFCSLIYRKALKMRSESLSEIGIGRIVTLVSKDVNNFESIVIFLNDIWISAILLITSSYLLYSQIGVAALLGLLFLVLIIPLQVWLGKITSNLRIEASKVTDHRLQVTQESLSAIKIIKMYVWENFFGEKMSKARKNEMEKVKRIYFARATFLEIGSLVISLTTYVIVMTYTKLGHDFTPEIYSYLMSSFHILRSPVTISLPLGILYFAELIASVRRIHTVLTAEEQEIVRSKQTVPLIQLEKVAVKDVLHDINLKIDAGLYVVTGKCGSGKTTLLKTILEESAITSGEVKVKGTVSYAPEEPWLFPSSIKENIIFGQSYNKDRYRKVLEICALESDIGSFVDEDETIINDRGMNLSKGQQARISLARAVYCDSDIYLLDDCLASLDTHLQDLVFRECIKGFLKDKIVVLISHNPRHIKQANNVVILEDGTIKSCAESSKIRDEEIVNVIEKNNEDEVAEDSRNIYHETKKDGKVDMYVYKQYCKVGGGLFMLILIFALFIIAQAASVATEKLLSSWVNLQQKFSKSGNTTKYQELMSENETMSGFYTLAVVATVLFFFFRAYALLGSAAKASLVLHNSMVSSIVNATMSFFDFHYIGNILNRCAKDFSTIDETLPFNIYECFKSICKLVGTLILILQVSFYFTIPASIVIVCLLLVRNFYIRSGRSLKRLDSATRSPVIGHLNASLEGLITIKAHGTQKILTREFDRRQDLYTSAYYMLQSSIRAFAYFLDLLCNFFTAAIIIILLIVDNGTQAGSVGLALGQALSLNGLLQWGIREWANIESHMTSVERVLEYTNAEKEEKNGEELEKWPTNGKITYKNVSLTYSKSKEYVLKNINFTILPGEKIGIVGRTGVGKTSLVSLLFRLYNYEGTITIDDTDTRILSLEFLRSRIAIIPQDPILFTGTIKSNIDPTGRYQDAEIWNAVNAANLKKLIPSLYYPVSDNGSNFSSGQKQLICLARAIVRKSKIVILDEATANVDLETDAMISKIIRNCFDSCTIVTIAHRLETVLNSDRVMVIDRGEVAEFDDPKVLVSKRDGYFSKMIEEANL